MIYNIKNRINDTIESQKEKKTCFNAHFQHIQLKITGLYYSVRGELVFMHYNISDRRALFFLF